MDARQAEPSMLDLPVYEELFGTAHKLLKECYIEILL